MAADAPPPSTPLSRPPISTALIHSPGLLTCWLASRITLQSASTSCSPGTGGPLSSNAPQPERLSYPYDRVNILHRGSSRTRTLLRGCAVIGVLLGHLFGIGSLSVGAIATKGQWNYTLHVEPFETWRTALEIITPLLGMNFVILFFVQSGYLMGKVFFEGRYNASSGKRAFYWARYLRLAPLLYFNLVVCIGLFRYADLDPGMILGDVLFINNFTGRGVNLVTWSLSHEMQYYLIAPFIYLACHNLTGWRAVAGGLVLLASAYGIGWLIPQLGFMYAFAVGF